MIEYYFLPDGETGDRDLRCYTPLRMKFPAGEEHIRPLEKELGDGVGVAYIRGADANEYMGAALWSDLMDSLGKKTVVMAPYLPAARADRGHPFGAKKYADLINLIGADQVITFDPHSPVMPSLIDNLTVVDLATVVEAEFARLENLDLQYAGVIIPDNGAKARSTAVAEALGVPTFQALKHRNEADGKLSGFSCEPLPETGRFLIPDDICDGGGTFRGLVKATGLPPERVDLVVSHGVFSANGYDSHTFSNLFTHIFTTDSHPGYDNPNIGAIKFRLLPYLTKAINV
jgi:ribose-phosphate pyrophosphokinase